MGWLIMGLAALLTGGLLWRFGRFPRGSIELLGAALLIGLAGYAWQGRPGLAGSPTPPPADLARPDGDFATERDKVMERFGSAAQVLDAADAFHRQGLDRYAIGIIKGALEKQPNSADLWVGLGNAFVIHNDGMMSPAAQFAFERAARISPDHPGPPFFLGLALAQSGQTDQAAEVWQGLLQKSPPNAPWRADLEVRLAQLQAGQGR